MGIKQHVMLLVEYHNGEAFKETVNADAISSKMFRLLHSPGFVQGIAAGDEFRLTNEDGAFEVTRRDGNLAVQLFSKTPIAPVVGAVGRAGGQAGR